MYCTEDEKANLYTSLMLVSNLFDFEISFKFRFKKCGDDLDVDCSEIKHHVDKNNKLVVSFVKRVCGY